MLYSEASCTCSNSTLLHVLLKQLGREKGSMGCGVCTSIFLCYAVSAHPTPNTPVSIGTCVCVCVCVCVRVYVCFFVCCSVQVCMQMSYIHVHIVMLYTVDFMVINQWDANPYTLYTYKSAYLALSQVWGLCAADLTPTP